MGSLRLVSLGLAVIAGAPAFAQLNNLDEALRTTPITTQELAPNFHVLFGVGGNILVSIGANGVLIVDDQFPQMVPKYKAKIGELGGGAVEFRDQHALALRSRRRQSGARPRRHVARRARDVAADDDEEQRHQSRHAKARSAGLCRDGVARADLRRHDALSLQRRAHRSHAFRPRAHDGRHGRHLPRATRPCTWATSTTTPAIRSSTPTTAAA